MVKRLPDEALRVGDVCDLWCGRKRILAIRPYTGPLKDIIFAHVDVDQGVGFALERGGSTLVVCTDDDNRPAW